MVSGNHAWIFMIILGVFVGIVLTTLPKLLGGAITHHLEI